MSQRIMNVVPYTFDTSSLGLNYFVAHSLESLEVFPVFFNNSRQLIAPAELVMFKPTASDEVQVAWATPQSGTMYLFSFSDKLFDVKAKMELMEKDLLFLGTAIDGKLSKETYSQYRLYMDQKHAAQDKENADLKTQLDQLTQRVDRL